MSQNARLHGTVRCPRRFVGPLRFQRTFVGSRGYSKETPIEWTRSYVSRADGEPWAWVLLYHSA